MRADETCLIAERLNAMGDELKESEHAFQWESEHLNCWLTEKKNEVHSEWEQECKARRDECESASEDIDRKKKEAHNAFDRRCDEIEVFRDRETGKIISTIFAIEKRAKKISKKLLKRYPDHSILLPKEACTTEELSSEEFDALLEKLALNELTEEGVNALFTQSFFDGGEGLCSDVMVDHAGEPLKAVKADLKEIDALLEKLHDETFAATLKRIFHLFGYCPRKEMACDIRKKIDEGILFEKQRIEEERAKAEEIKESERTKLWAEIDHLDKMRMEAEARSKAGIAKATGAKNQKTESFEATAAKKRKAASNTLARAKEGYAQQLRDLDLPFLNAEEKKRRTQLGASEEQWNEPFFFPEKSSGLFPVGVVGRDIHLSGDRLRELSRISDGMVSQDGVLRGVACHSFEDRAPIWIEYRDQEETVMAGVRFMLAAKLRLLPFDELRILFCDAKSRGINLGRLNRFVNDQRGKIAIEVCATNSQEVESCLSSENRNMGKIGQRLAPYSNVSEFNKNAKVRERIPYTVIVVNDIDDEFFPEQGVVNLRSMLRSAAKFGYDVIVTSHALENVEDRRKREQIEKLRDSFCVVREQEGGNFILEEGDSFEFFSDEIVTDAFLSSFAERFFEERKKREDATVEVDVSRFINDDGSSVFGRKHLGCVDAKSGQLGDLAIPYGVDDLENVAVFSLGHNPNYSALVTGSVGSGKSVFLHSLINNIAANYYPSEIELWLVDFKGVEFDYFI
ncbi:FtsK/SpoIIIE domain-containing protein [Adlercreutzia shanghongiae]|uniref:FtsK/SpoIIIE domain-containing protein n=1 Tax=Adlercreutzia shanghongiae TaxID=3111773 RepID=A0ABU6IVH9_9ACTN|nr:FtsK/SpoIIIE domain-containing protein [Adlercreutzia sp. R22]MEC4293832.1 FtsK/SpoIIIE domain-containing protein [Adlercreutzia sp. R22]